MRKPSVADIRLAVAALLVLVAPSATGAAEDVYGPPILTTIASGWRSSVGIGIDCLTDCPSSPTLTGSPFFAYQETTAKALKVAHADDAACTGSTITTVDDDPVNNVVGYLSAALGSDGFPIIAYTDSTAWALKVAHCSNPACTGSTITTVDDFPDPNKDLGGYPSIAIGVDGLPVISSIYMSYGLMRVVRCGNVACTSGKHCLRHQSLGVWPDVHLHLNRPGGR